VKKSEEERKLGKPKRMWEDNINVNLREIGGVVSIGFIWFRIWAIGWLL
jgi:hypothetical protein